jgi:hypothetical protein
VPEGDLLRLVGQSSLLPPVIANPDLRTSDGRPLTSPDLWFDDVGLAVMVQSREFHSRGLDWDVTVEAGSDLAVARVVAVGVTPAALARDPHRQLRRIEAAYAAARRSGQRAAVVATPTAHHARPHAAERLGHSGLKFWTMAALSSCTRADGSGGDHRQNRQTFAHGSSGRNGWNR